MSELARQSDRAKLTATMLMTLPGVPFIYYGEEIGMTGQKPDEKIRTPMQWTAGPSAGFSRSRPWEAVNSGYEEVNVETESADPGSLLAHYKALIALRNEHVALRTGAWAPVEVDNRRVVAFLRQSQEETFLLLFNLNDKPENEYALTLAEGMLAPTSKADELVHAADVTASELDGDGRFTDYHPIAELAPRTGYVMRLAL